MSDDRGRKEQYKTYLKDELTCAATYGALAETEKDPRRAEVFHKLVEAEMRHAARWAQKLGVDPSTLRLPRLGVKGRLMRAFARRFGTAKVVPFLLMSEGKGMQAYFSDPEAQDLAREERGHSAVLRSLGDYRDPVEAVRAESRHIADANGSLRAAVLGVNDGLVSNFSLVMGVAGGTSEPRFVLLAGVAGMLAGAFSMAAGEYISMRSQRDLYEHRIRMEKVELERWPEEEEEELVLIYQAKGLSQEEARRIAKNLITKPEVALETMTREELGLDPAQLGSPWGAAVASFAAFVGGAIVPIAPYIFGAGKFAFSLSAVLSGVALLTVGGTLAWMTSRSAAWGALRMLMAGGAAAAVTYGVGRLIGVTLAG